MESLTQQPGTEQKTRNDTHCFLRVIAPVPQAVQRGRHQLPLSEDVVHLSWGASPEYPIDRGTHPQCKKKSRRRGDKHKRDRLKNPVPHEAFRSCLYECRAYHSSDERVGGTRWQAEIPGNEVPAAGSHKRAKYDALVYDCYVDNSSADGVGNVQAQEKKGDKIEKCRPEDGIAWREYPSRNDGSD